MNKKKLEKLIKILISDQKARIAATKERHWLFFAVYLGHYLKYPSASFQKQMFAITENDKIRNAVIVAFRNSAKSTIITLSYSLWATLGKQQKKFVVILGQTQNKAKQYLTNIKKEYENNSLLLSDYGPFKEETDEWGSYSLVLKCGARISAVSSEQSIRGLRHGQYRPDLIIADDVEDLESTKTLEGRDRAYNWLNGEVIPAGDQSTKLVVVGNLLHEDSLIMRLKEDIEQKRFDGIFWAYPFADDEGNAAWPGKFSTPEIVKAERSKIGDEVTWQREYMLRIVPDKERVIQPEWIKSYDNLPDKKANNFRYVITGIDLALSKNEKADYTAMVSANIYGYGEDLRIYIHPNPVNERLTSLEAQERAELVSRSLGNGTPTKLIVENVGYQGSFVEIMNNKGIPTEEFKVQGQDKRARLSLAASPVQAGKVFFPRQGAEKLVEQLINFGFQKHDDLADAFAMVVLETLRKNKKGGIICLRVGGRDYISPYLQSNNPQPSEPPEKDPKDMTPAEHIKAENEAFKKLLLEEERKRLNDEMGRYL